MPSTKHNKDIFVGAAKLFGACIGRRPLQAGPSEVQKIDTLVLAVADAVSDLAMDSRRSFFRGNMTKLHALTEPFRGAASLFSAAGFLGGPLLANLWMGLGQNTRGLQNFLGACGSDLRSVCKLDAAQVLNPIMKKPSRPGQPGSARIGLGDFCRCREEHVASRGLARP